MTDKGPEMSREWYQCREHVLEASFKLLAVHVRSGMGSRWHLGGTGFSAAEYGCVSLVGNNDGKRVGGVPGVVSVLSAWVGGFV